MPHSHNARRLCGRCVHTAAPGSAHRRAGLFRAGQKERPGRRQAADPTLEPMPVSGGLAGSVSLNCPACRVCANCPGAYVPRRRSHRRFTPETGLATRRSGRRKRRLSSPSWSLRHVHAMWTSSGSAYRPSLEPYGYLGEPCAASSRMAAASATSSSALLCDGDIAGARGPGDGARRLGALGPSIRLCVPR